MSLLFWKGLRTVLRATVLLGLVYRWGSRGWKQRATCDQGGEAELGRKPGPSSWGTTRPAAPLCCLSTAPQLSGGTPNTPAPLLLKKILAGSQPDPHVAESHQPPEMAQVFLGAPLKSLSTQVPPTGPCVDVARWPSPPGQGQFLSVQCLFRSAPRRLNSPCATLKGHLHPSLPGPGPTSEPGSKLFPRLQVKLWLCGLAVEVQAGITAPFPLTSCVSLHELYLPHL